MPTFAKAVNKFSTILASDHTAGDGGLVLADASGLGSLGSNRIFRVTAVRFPGTTNEQVLGVFEATGIVGNTLTGVTSSTGDVDLAVGTTIQRRWTAQDAESVYDAINATLRNVDSFSYHTYGGL